MKNVQCSQRHSPDTPPFSPQVRLLQSAEAPVTNVGIPALESRPPSEACPDGIFIYGVSGGHKKKCL
jgi:hypothetical protein